MTMLQPQTLKFLKDLRKNNNREWFDKNRMRYEEAKKDFENFITKLIVLLAKNDKSLAGVKPKDCIFRIFRDVRFSKNKDPYKPNFGAYICNGGRKANKAGIYIHIEPSGGWGHFIAGGRWMPESQDLKAIRQEIQYHTTEFKKIINHKNFKKFFKQLDGEKLKTVPKGFDKSDPDIELYKYTSYMVSYKLPEADLLTNDILKKSNEIHKALLPFFQFLDKAVS